MIYSHPLVSLRSNEWLKYRLTLESGDLYKDAYLSKYSIREDEEDFKHRKRITYVPRRCVSILSRLRNLLLQRLTTVERLGGSDSYTQAMRGQGSGVDQKGSSMLQFLGSSVILELMAMGKVGVMCDAPDIRNGATLSDTKNISPYLYTYTAENIINWKHDSLGRLTLLSLRNRDIGLDSLNIFPCDYKETNLIFTLADGGVNVTDEENTFSTLLEIPEIPFTIIELPDSLLKDAADYQIALMNMTSTDVSSIIRSNFPVITQQEPNLLPVSKRQQAVELGASHGLYFPKEGQRPEFIAPPASPLEVSMKKQELINNELESIIGANTASLASSSADTKMLGNEGPEAGLAYIGLLLQTAEMSIARHWHMYESTSNEVTVRYPRFYSMPTASDTDLRLKQLESASEHVPSTTFKRIASYQIARLLVEPEASFNELEKIKQEIEDAKVVSIDPDTLHQDLEDGLVDDTTASIARGYPDGCVDQARKDKAARLALIAISQTQGIGAARGISDASADPAGEKKLEREQAAVSNDPSQPQDITRGEAK